VDESLSTCADLVTTRICQLENPSKAAVDSYS